MPENAYHRRALIAYTVIILVMSSPILISTNPQLIAAAAGPITLSTMADTSNYHSTFSVSPSASNTASFPSTNVGTPATNVSSSSTSNQGGGDFTTQAALSPTQCAPSLLVVLPIYSN